MPSRPKSSSAAASSSRLSNETMPAPLPPMFGLTSSGKRRLARGGDGRVAVVDDARAREADAEPREQRALARLRELVRVGAVAVEHVRADPVEVREVVERVEDRAARARASTPTGSSGSRRASTGLGLRRVERVPLRVQPLVRDPAPLELREQRLEPERVLVEDRDGPVHVQLKRPRPPACSRSELGDLGVPVGDAALRPVLGEARRRGRRRRRPAARCAPGARDISRLRGHLVPLLGDDRHAARARAAAPARGRRSRRQ